MSMDIDKLPNNSNAVKNKAQTPAPTNSEKKVKKVVTGKVRVKKNEVKKFADIFVAEDVESVKNYVVDDLIIPTAKNLVVDVVQNFIEMLVLGGRRGTGRGRSIDSVTYRDYSGISRRSEREPVSRSRNRFDYEDFGFAKRADAENVLDQMEFLIKKYGLATVADLYDMCDESAPHTAHKYGWTSMGRADIKCIRGEWFLDLPKASPID